MVKTQEYYNINIKDIVGPKKGLKPKLNIRSKVKDIYVLIHESFRKTILIDLLPRMKIIKNKDVFSKDIFNLNSKI